MIKKLTIGVAIIAALILVGVLYFKRATGPSDSATLVASDTVFFLNVTDIPRTALRWQQTALAKIAQEPEMKAFLEKPIARLLAQPGLIEAMTILGSLKPGTLFLAVTSVSASNVELLVGFQYWGTRSDYDQAIARMRKQIPGGAGEATKEVHGGHEILVSTHGTQSVYSASAGRWGFVATNLDALKAALDRATGTLKDPTLATNPRFAAVLAQLNPEPDATVFIQPEKALNALLDVGGSVGAQPVPSQIEALRSTEAIGATWRLDGLVQRDAIFALRKSTPPAAALGHKIIDLTSKDTIAVVEASLRTEGLANLVKSSAPQAEQIPEILALIDLATQSFGQDAGLVANWPAGQTAPSVFAALDVKDKDKAAQFLTQVLQFAPNHTTSTTGGLTLYSIPSGNPIASPTITQTDSFLFIGLDPATVVQIASRQPGVASLTATPYFALVADSFKKSNESFAFIDTKTVFERAYNALRPIIIFGATVMPDIGAVVDTTKLPQTETVTKHLTPMTLSQTISAEGTLIESSGPLTINQTLLAVLVAAGAASPQLLGR